MIKKEFRLPKCLASSQMFFFFFLINLNVRTVITQCYLLAKNSPFDRLVGGFFPLSLDNFLTYPSVLIFRCWVSKWSMCIIFHFILNNIRMDFSIFMKCKKSNYLHNIMRSINSSNGNNKKQNITTREHQHPTPKTCTKSNISLYNVHTHYRSVSRSIEAVVILWINFIFCQCCFVHHFVRDIFPLSLLLLLSSKHKAHDNVNNRNLGWAQWAL